MTPTVTPATPRRTTPVPAPRPRGAEAAAARRARTGRLAGRPLVTAVRSGGRLVVVEPARTA